MTEGNENLLYVDRTDMIKFFISNANKFKPMTPEMEIETFRKAKAGDEKARHLIINSNQMFVYSIAKQYTATGDMLEDLISEGIAGLMNAYDKFDQEKGFKFITFAVHYIRGAIERYINNIRPSIRLHEHNTAFIGKIRRYKQDFFKIHGYEPTTDMIMEHFEDIGKPIPDRSLCVDTVYISIDSPVSGNDEDESLLFADDSEYTSSSYSENAVNEASEREEVRQCVSDVMSVLNDREKDIVKATFGIGYEFEVSDDEIAAKYGIGVVRVRQIRAAAMEKMQKSSDKYEKRYAFA